jgi:hypothetical protein
MISIYKTEVVEYLDKEHHLIIYYLKDNVKHKISIVL